MKLKFVVFKLKFVFYSLEHSSQSVSCNIKDVQYTKYQLLYRTQFCTHGKLLLLKFIDLLIIRLPTATKPIAVGCISRCCTKKTRKTPKA